MITVGRRARDRLSDLQGMQHTLLHLRNRWGKRQGSSLPGLRQRPGRPVFDRRGRRGVTDRHDSYTDPLTQRYASPEMSRIFSPRFKFETWRRLWILLAEEEKRLGLPIPDEALAQMRAKVSEIDFDAAAAHEK